MKSLAVLVWGCSLNISVWHTRIARVHTSVVYAPSVFSGATVGVLCVCQGEYMDEHDSDDSVAGLSAGGIAGGSASQVDGGDSGSVGGPTAAADGVCCPHLRAAGLISPTRCRLSSLPPTPAFAQTFTRATRNTHALKCFCALLRPHRLADPLHTNHHEMRPCIPPLPFARISVCRAFEGQATTI